jgi:hypothetical protein
MVSEDLKPLFRQAMVWSIFNIHRYITCVFKAVTWAGVRGGTPGAPTFKEPQIPHWNNGKCDDIKLRIPSAKLLLRIWARALHKYSPALSRLKNLEGYPSEQRRTIRMSGKTTRLLAAFSGQLGFRRIFCTVLTPQSQWTQV